MKNVLISKTAIPASEIGSWNHTLTELIARDAGFFEYIISPKSKIEVNSNRFLITNEKRKDKLLSILLKNKHYNKLKYWRELRDRVLPSIDKNEKINIIIFDDYKTALAIDFFAKKTGYRSNISINYFLRGYNFDLPNQVMKAFYSAIDKLVVQTYSSYRYQLKHNNSLPCEVSVLPNGINDDLFYKLSDIKKATLKRELGFETNKKIYLWLSQDRPKKGLKILLKAWGKFNKIDREAILIVIGTNKKAKGKNIIWLGRMNKKELSIYYQISDYFLFTSLVHEGHSQSLTEAIKCGVKCFVSDIEPNSEIIKKDKYGYLVKDPNIVSNWVKIIENSYNNKIIFNDFDTNDIYTFTEWMKNFKKLLIE